MPSHAQVALAVLNQMREAGMPVRSSVIFTRRTDPDSSLGTGSGPAEKVVFFDARVNRGAVVDHCYWNPEFGGQVEVYPDPAAAARQADSGPDGYRVLVRGSVLVRLSPHLTRLQVAEYADVLTHAVGGLSASGRSRLADHVGVDAARSLLAVAG
ncbi:MAG: hypothetical protein HYR62_09910 [Actinobacteria bacterium]|nr:hypothetical protein [Actinomycetota bacterium]MBI3686436.1 hypothetical protein [Actinomycetota bacterium]